MRHESTAHVSCISTNPSGCNVHVDVYMGLCSVHRRSGTVRISAGGRRMTFLLCASHTENTCKKRLCERRHMELDEGSLAVPLPAFSPEVSSDDEEGAEHEPIEAAGSTSEHASEVLRRIVASGCDGVLPCLGDIEFWRNVGSEDGLHVCELTSRDSEVDDDVIVADAASVRDSLHKRGYSHGTRSLIREREVLDRVKCGLRTLKRHGFAPAFIYVFDEAWMVLEPCWRLLGSVLSPDAPSDVVLEPAINAHVLSRPGDNQDGGSIPGDSSQIQRHTTLGGAFPLPHRDHSSAECLSDASATGRSTPSLLSLWVPLTDVTTDNGCMFVVPSEADDLLHQPSHRKHLLPFDRETRRCNFELASAVALAPAPAGSALCWLGLSHPLGDAAHSSQRPNLAPRSLLACATNCPSNRAAASGAGGRARSDPS